MKNCTFHNNTSDGNFTMKPYQGSAGGLSIGYNDTHLRREISSINIHIIKCNFTSNAAVLPINLTLSSTEVLSHKRFPGRGGALIVLISTHHPLNFVLNDSKMMDNSAQNFGASIYCVIIDGYYNQTYVFANNVFMNNTAPIGSGLTFANLVNRPINVHSLIYSCTFIDNTATSEVSGAANAYALYGLPNNIVIFRDCKFYNNNAEMYGGAVDIASYNFFENREEVFPVHFINWLVSYI